MGDTMIERVARRLAAKAFERFTARDARFVAAKYPGVEEYCDTEWRLYADDARATIEAMREPTEAMGDAGYDAAAEAYNSGGAPGYSDEIWKAMMAAALKEGVAAPPAPRPQTTPGLTQQEADDRTRNITAALAGEKPNA